MNTLIPFASRAEALRLSRLLSARRIACTVINTPRKLGVSCGLTVVFSEHSLSTVQEIIKNEGFKTKQGVFKR